MSADEQRLLNLLSVEKLNKSMTTFYGFSAFFLILITINKNMDYTKLSDIEVEGIDYADYPDFCDAYISDAKLNGINLTDKELELLNENSQFVYECVEKHIY